MAPLTPVVTVMRGFTFHPLFICIGNMLQKWLPENDVVEST